MPAFLPRSACSTVSRCASSPSTLPRSLTMPAIEAAAPLIATVPDTTEPSEGDVTTSTGALSAVPCPPIVTGIVGFPFTVTGPSKVTFIETC